MEQVGKTVKRARQRVVTRTEVSDQLDSFVRQLEDDTLTSLSGILVSGDSGSGKTLLVENYLQRVESTHPVLIARHYQRHQSIPYFGFKYCISDYLSKIYNKSNKAELHEFSDRLKRYLGESFPLLIDYVPELSLIFGMQVPFPVRSNLTIQNQLYPLFHRLFEFLSDFYKRPVFLFTDDLQWIDASGINLLKYLLLNLSNQKLVWIGASRELQNKTSLLGQLLEELRVEEIGVENMVLKGLNREEARLLIEATLGAPCHIDLIDTCHKLTEGGQSRLHVLLDSLKASDLIWHDANVIHGDSEAIKTQFEGLHLQRRLLEQVHHLSGDAYDVVCIMACMGRFNKRIIVDWLLGDEVRMKELLDEATDAGILEAYEQEVRFAKMDVGELIYNELTENRRLELHYKIANLFYARGLDRLNSTELILMASSFNESIDRVKADGRMQLVADVNYQAGKILQHDKAFDQARYYLKMSAEMLKECAWENIEEQVWLVHMDRARIEYSLREYDLAEIHLDYLLARISDPLKRAKVFELKMTINNHLARYQKAVWILGESLGELGLALPLEEQPLLDEVERLKEMLWREEAEPQGYLSDHRLNSDHSEAVLRLLYVGGMSLHHTSDVLMTWAALQIILSANHERPSAVKAIGYVSYGRMLIISGDIQKGYESGTKGLDINKSLDDITLRCRVFGVYAFYIQPWVKDFAESDKLLQDAAEAGQKSGDLIGLYILKTHQLNLHLISGLPLKGLARWDFEESYPGMELTYYITHYQKSLIRYLTGESSVFSIPRQNPSSLAGRLTIQEEKFYRHYVWARYYFLFGHFELAARASEDAHANRKLQEGSPLLPANLMIWFLSVTQNWFRYTELVRKELTVRVTEVLDLFATWKTCAPANYDPAWLLLNAEWSRIQDNEEDALLYFQRSFEASRTNIYHRAVTAELWAKFLLSRNGEDAQASVLLQAAIDSFNDWNGIAKCRQLMQQFEAVLPHVVNPQIIDIETIQYELSGDMEVSSLVSKLMVLLLRISGSTRVVVELVEETGERASYHELSLLHHAGQQPMVPTSMILMALKSQSVVVVNELRAEQALRNVDGLHERGVQSFLILPVTVSGHLSMVIYLENVLARNWYAPERVKSVKITANQGAVMIENARIHEHSVKLNEDLRKEMAEKERLSTVIELQKDAHLSALMQAQDSERKRIASDLHDSLGSLLSSVRLRFNGLQYEFCQRVPERTQGFDDSLKLLDEAIDELRRISHNMVPVSLSRFGLQSALETFVAQVVASGALTVDLQILGLEIRLPEELEVRVYRICQELVQNVIKHARAKKVRIQIILHRDSLNLVVEDDGIGLSKTDLSRGFGFSTIQSNVDLFKGTFDIESQPGKGCLVLIDLPIDVSRLKTGQQKLSGQ